jgi:hypothetical protein
MLQSDPTASRARRAFAAGPRRSRARRGPTGLGALAAALLAAAGCGEITDPYPQRLAPNVLITPTPAHGALIDADAAGRVVLAFDRAMEKQSVQRVQRLSFLLPLAARNFDGQWDDAATRVVFELSEFPVQPGATYEVRFVGLRTAAGELYNGGPFDLRFRTRGRADWFPMRPHPRVETRLLCRLEGDAGACAGATMHLDSVGVDSLRVRTVLEDRAGGRLDWFRRTAGHVEWLGWDDVDADDVAQRRVRWPQPPRLLASATARGTVLVADAQASLDGTQLLRWRTQHSGSDSPTTVVDIGGAPIEVVYSASATLDLDFALRGPDGVLEQRLERWWLYPGVGLVRRDVRVQRDDGTPPARVVETLVPSLVNFVR